MIRDAASNRTKLIRECSSDLTWRTSGSMCMCYTINPLGLSAIVLHTLLNVSGGSGNLSVVVPLGDAVADLL